MPCRNTKEHTPAVRPVSLKQRAPTPISRLTLSFPNHGTWLILFNSAGGETKLKGRDATMRKDQSFKAQNIIRRQAGPTLFLIAAILCMSGAVRGEPNQTALTSGDLMKIIAQSVSRSGEPISVTTQILSSLENRVTVSGDVLRKALADSNIVLGEPLSILIASVQSVTRSGNCITLKSDRELQTTINGSMVRLKPTVTLTFRMEGDSPTISNISGIAVHKLFWIDVQQIQLTMAQAQRTLRVATSCGSRIFIIPG